MVRNNPSVLSHGSVHGNGEDGGTHGRKQLTRSDSCNSRNVRRRSAGICVGKTNACTVGVNGLVGEAFLARACYKGINVQSIDEVACRLTSATESARRISSRRPRASFPITTKSSHMQSTRYTCRVNSGCAGKQDTGCIWNKWHMSTMPQMPPRSQGTSNKLTTSPCDRSTTQIRGSKNSAFDLHFQ